MQRAQTFIQNLGAEDSDACPFCRKNIPLFPRNCPLPDPRPPDAFRLDNGSRQIFEIFLHEPGVVVPTLQLWLVLDESHDGYRRRIRFAHAVGSLEWQHHCLKLETIIGSRTASEQIPRFELLVGSFLVCERRGERVTLWPPIAHIIPYFVPDL